MNSLPSSIESYLKDAGFSATEILILNKLMDEQSLTLRQIAAKTGKSTGVLDQAIKKLLRRTIVTKEWVNDAHKYTLISLKAISDWVQRDMKEKRELMERRHQNFETFIQTLKVDHKRPEMQFYEGDEGIKQAYRRLLEHAKETLHYFPVLCAIEDDPLRDFRVQYFRERRAKGVFSRYIIHNTPLGRRFASRDPFEYRKSMPIPEDAYPISFEKVITGDIVACFNHVEKRVCFLRYPELAETERRLFERLWHEQEHAAAFVASDPAKPTDPQIPLSTRTLSGIREFFLSRKSIVTFVAFALIAAAVTYGLYLHTYNLNTQRVRERAMSIAATGAMQFDARELDQLHTPEDVKKPVYAKVIKILNEIRAKNEGVRFAYILRPTKEKGYWEFVADADSLHPDKPIDDNQNGIIESAEQLSYPGDKYPHYDSYMEMELKQTFAYPGFDSDQWGINLTAYSPITETSKTVAVLGIDFRASDVQSLTGRTFNSILYFFAFFLLFVFIRLAAFNKSLFVELWQAFKMRRVLLSLALAAEIAFFVTLGLYFYTFNLLREEMGQKLLAVAATAAGQFNPDDLNQLHFARDMRTEAYQRVFKKLNEIRDNNDGIQWVYVLRPVDPEYMWEFVADADSNFDIPFWIDDSKDGVQTSDELNIGPGNRYYAEGSILLEREMIMNSPIIDEIYTDQWGTYLSAYAPIRAGERGIAVLGVDMELSDILQVHRRKFIFSLWFIGLFAALVLFGLLASRLSRSSHSSHPSS